MRKKIPIHNKGLHVHAHADETMGRHVTAVLLILAAMGTLVFTALQLL